MLFTKGPEMPALRRFKRFSAKGKKIGRPSNYTDEVGREICNLLVEGKSLAAICRMESMPDYRTVYSWLKRNPKFAAEYSEAREAQADTDADKVGDIADDVIKGRISHDQARVAISAYKWTAAVRKPKVYGTRVALGGGEGMPPIRQAFDVKKLSTEALRELHGAMLEDEADTPDES